MILDTNGILKTEQGASGPQWALAGRSRGGTTQGGGLVRWFVAVDVGSGSAIHAQTVSPARRAQHEAMSDG